MNVPPGWGDDKLSAYLAIAQRNTFASFVQHQPAYTRLLAIDLQFRTLLDGLDSLSRREELVASLPCFRAHACFLASTGLALAGQPYEAAAVSRASLECALYGLFIVHKAGAADLWLHRDRDAASKRRMKDTFTAGAVLNHLRKVNPKLGGPVKEVYEMLIDLGAHPNPAGLLGSAESEETAEGTRLNTVYLCDNSITLWLGIKNSTRAGLASLAIVCETYPTRAEILGVKAKLASLAAGL